MAPIIQAGLPGCGIGFSFFCLPRTQVRATLFCRFAARGCNRFGDQASFSRKSRSRTRFKQQRTAAPLHPCLLARDFVDFFVSFSAFRPISGKVFRIRTTGRRVGLVRGRGIAGVRKRRGRNHVRGQEI